jgi:hypothetical protein
MYHSKIWRKITFHIGKKDKGQDEENYSAPSTATEDVQI